MNILIDIGHPAHVHIFKNLAWEMQKSGHSFIFTVRQGEFEAELLEKYGFNYTIIGYKVAGTINKIRNIGKFSHRILKISKTFKPDLFLSHGSMYAGIAAKLLNKPHIALEDSGNMEQLFFSKLVSSIILTPDVLPVHLGKKQITYKAYHELFYLHPDYFKPDNSVLDILNMNENDTYAIVRFVSWQASHDKKQSGFTDSEKIKLIKILSKDMKVFISSEKELPVELEKYKMQIPFDRVHDALAFAAIYIGEGATMASEAGVMGTPSIYVSSIKRCYNDDQEKYGTVINISPGKDTLLRVQETLKETNKLTSQQKADGMIKEKIDPTQFLVWFIENYPGSIEIMKNKPNYQNRFK